ncbi:MAG: PTS fructose transporter subunit IIC [Anaerolineaceae bacterium]|nr:PTS fructose transporter subunit IIC [Anaerolineaceae bacterium]
MKKKSRVYRDLMSGVSHFIPFIVAGGVLISFAFLFDAKNASLPTFGTTTAVPAWLLNVGVLAMGLMLPILAGYIAYSISDRPGLLAGMVAGLLAKDGGSGFLGAILGGFAAGYVIKLLRYITRGLPRSFEGAKTLIVFPIFGVILTALVMIPVNYVVVPINSFMNGILQSLSTGSAVILGAVLGAMIAFDMGGPINKAAYLFAVASLTSATGTTAPSIAMGAVGCSAMCISSSCALATILFPKKFSPELKEAGKPAWIMGASFIAEGAIPFAVENPKVVIPSIVTGTALAGALAGLFKLTLTAPIGGIFTLPLVNNIPLYLLCAVIGTIVGALMIGLLSKDYVPDIDEEEQEEGLSTVA